MWAKTCCSMVPAEARLDPLGPFVTRSRVDPERLDSVPASDRRSKLILARVCAKEAVDKNRRVNIKTTKGDFIRPHFGSWTILAFGDSWLCARAFRRRLPFRIRNLFVDSAGETAPLN
jgi:hypothetical protein